VVTGKTVMQSLWLVFRDILTHSRFGKCTSSASRKSAHLGAFYGFWILFFVSAWAVVMLYILNPFLENPLPYPFPFLDPAKIIANIGAIALVIGCFLAIKDRLGSGPVSGLSTDYDWMFLGTLLMVGLTGIMVEALRFAELVTPGYIIYFFHLIFAFMLLIYLPYSKFAHLFYRTTAMVYAEYSGRTDRSTENAAPSSNSESTPILDTEEAKVSNA
jgi:quinone-modifying oxidoreductase subunit QmoC